MQIPQTAIGAALSRPTEIGRMLHEMRRCAVPNGEPVYVPDARRPEPAAPIMITIIIPAQE